MSFPLGKPKIIYGEDKIIRVGHGLPPKRFPGGIGTEFFKRMHQYRENIAQVRSSDYFL